MNNQQPYLVIEPFEGEFNNQTLEDEARRRRPFRGGRSRPTRRPNRPAPRPGRPQRFPFKPSRRPRPILPIRPIPYPYIPQQEPPHAAQEPSSSGSSGSPASEPTGTQPVEQSTEFVRWVQTTLNQILNLQLPVDGVLNVQTRSAIRSFQEKNGLPATGVVGPDTQQALMSAGSGGSTTAAAAKPDEPGSVDAAEPTAPATEFEFEWEVNRKSRGYIKWIQQSLNRILGLRLAEDGIMGAQTRSAIRSFQQKHGLKADGVVGERTEAAIKGASMPSTTIKPAHLQYVKDLSGPATECTAALKRAGKTKAEALTIINTQIDIAIRLLRKAENDLKRGSRSSTTSDLFLKIFRVRPQFVPTWLKQTATIKDRGDVVATRCGRVADLLAGGRLKFFCTINSTNCPDCSNDPSDFACSSWGDESTSPGNSNVICLGNAFWDDMKAGNTTSLLATLMHEPFHIYYGKYVTAHVSSRGKFGGINCIVQFVFETGGRTPPSRVSQRCTNMAVRQELELMV